MVWFKVDDTLALHAKTIAAGNAAMGLWVRAGAWSMQQLTDGHIPSEIASVLGTKPEANRLVRAGLWDLVADGYQFHEWSNVQRTKAQVSADRDAAADRQRHARERAKSQRESRRDKGVSHGPPDQTRPDIHPSDVSSASAGAERGPDTIASDFDEWYAAYPRKRGRGQALRAYKAALKKTDAATLLAAIEQQTPSLIARGAEFAPYPATWLNGERWADQPDSLLPAPVVPITGRGAERQAMFDRQMQRAIERERQMGIRE